MFFFSFRAYTENFVLKILKRYSSTSKTVSDNKVGKYAQFSSHSFRILNSSCVKNWNKNGSGLISEMKQLQIMVRIGDYLTTLEVS